MLDRPSGRLMVVATALGQLERWPQNRADRRRIMTNHRQATASLGTVERKRRDDDMSARTHRLADPIGIGRLILGGSQEVKRRTVVPHVIALRRPPLCDVLDD